MTSTESPVRHATSPAASADPETGAEAHRSSLRLPARPQLSPGVELLGEYEGSGFSQPQWLLRRPDGQVIQVSTLLYLIAQHADGEVSLEDLADRVTARFARPVSAANVQYLLEQKLLPLGVISPADGATAAAPRADLLLRVRARRDAIPEWLVNRLAVALTPLFRPIIVALTLVTLAAFDFWLFAIHGVQGSLTELATRPTSLLLVYGILVASMVFHEIGHATACRYGGARPGAIGGGIYLVWPALYTDVTDAYRLNRAGRLRTDLGGIYFNGVSVLVVAAVYAVTTFEPLLIASVLIQVLAAQQLLPLVRFDGYYILADLVGVPDLFRRVKPTLRSLLPKHRNDPQVLSLKRSARVTITLWVLLVVPFLLLVLVLIVINLPSLATTTATAMRTHTEAAALAARANDVPAAVVAVLNIALVGLTALATLYLLALVASRAVLPLARVAKAVPAALLRTRSLGGHVEGSQDAQSQPADRSSDGGPAQSTPAHGTGDGAGVRPRVTAPPSHQRLRRRWKKVLPAEERRQQLLDKLVTAEPDDVSVVTVSSQIGGVGKTHIAAHLATLAAQHRTNDRVFAVDINPDAGRLGTRMAVQGGLSLRQTFEHRDTITTYAALRRSFRHTPAGVAVMTSDPTVQRDETFGEAEYGAVIDAMSVLTNVFVNDCGTNLLHPLTRGALARTDQLVYVTDCSQDGLELTQDAFDTFEAKGYGEQVRTGVLILNKVVPGSPVERFHEVFSGRCGHVLPVRYNELLAQRGPVDLEALDVSDAEALNDLLEVAATVFAGLAGRTSASESRR